MLSEVEIKTLLEKATHSWENAFLLSDAHNKGASVLTDQGDYFGGCNIDIKISGLGTCAERAAIDQMIISGQYKIKALAVVDERKKLYPCGACLQYLATLAMVNDNDVEIVVGTITGEYKIYKLSELLPMGRSNFSESALEKLKIYKNK